MPVVNKDLIQTLFSYCEKIKIKQKSEWRFTFYMPFSYTFSRIQSNAQYINCQLQWCSTSTVSFPIAIYQNCLPRESFLIVLKKISNIVSFLSLFMTKGQVVAVKPFASWQIITYCRSWFMSSTKTKKIFNIIPCFNGTFSYVIKCYLAFEFTVIWYKF